MSNTDTETALREMLRQRAGDITTLPAHLAQLDQADEPADSAGHTPIDLTEPHHRRSHSRLLIAAAAAVIVLIAGGVVGIRQLAGPSQRPASPNTVTPTSIPTGSRTAAPTSPAPTSAASSPSPSASATATNGSAAVPLACQATLPGTWKAALASASSAEGAQSASPTQVLPNGDILVTRDFGHGRPRDLAIVSPGKTPRSIFKVPDPDQLDVQGALITGEWLVVSVGLHPRAPKGVEPGSSPMPNVRSLYVIDLHSGAKKRIAATTASDETRGGRTIDMAMVLDGKVYWDVKRKYTSRTGVIKSYNLTTGETVTAYSGPLGYVSGGTVGLVSGIDPATVIIPAKLPAAVRANLNPSYALSLTSDGSAYAWEVHPREIAWWAPGHSRPVFLRLRQPVRVGGGAAMLVVSGHFVMTVQSPRLVDVKTGAVAKLPSGSTKDAPILISQGSTVAGFDSVGTEGWQNGYWMDPQPELVHFSTSSLPGLTCPSR